MKILVLGGTSDAKRIANELIGSAIEVTYSVAGLVRHPGLNCTVISGGFTQFGGLSRYLNTHGIDFVLDAVHPYAQSMRQVALESSLENKIPLVRYDRPPWVPALDDRWIDFNDWDNLVTEISGYRSVFFTVGQLDQGFVDQLTASAGEHQKQVLRTAIKPTIRLPLTMEWLKAIGQFAESSEEILFERFQFDALICKNSGGEATMAKLILARKRQIPVYMLERPPSHLTDNLADVREFGEVQSCVEYINQFKHSYT